MFSKMFSTLFLATALVSTFVSVQATIFVFSPDKNTVCHGGQSCNVQWSDNGVAPSLASIGRCTVGLFHEANGQDQLIERIHDSLDVSQYNNLTFVVNPAAGPNSGGYVVKFTALNPVNGSQFNQWSHSFKLDKMNGSFASPLPAATSTLNPNAAITVMATGTWTTSFLPTSTAPTTGTPSPVSNINHSGASRSSTLYPIAAFMAIAALPFARLAF
ncbi:hypothetical protein C8Q75DRAFT_730430 [Abortiporus biennis]|nr:hypothetical protein C8Q75DRAFT_730430 [Abortiporus biennis]